MSFAIEKKTRLKKLGESGGEGEDGRRVAVVVGDDSRQGGCAVQLCVRAALAARQLQKKTTTAVSTTASSFVFLFPFSSVVSPLHFPVKPNPALAFLFSRSLGFVFLLR
jgi:hypothetical protein